MECFEKYDQTIVKCAECRKWDFYHEVCEETGQPCPIQDRWQKEGE